MNTTYVYLNGCIMESHTASISPFDIGLLRGFSVFDLLRTVGGRPFLLDEHLKRLHASASELGLEIPVSDDQIAEAITELLRLNKHDEATVRLVLTGGPSHDGMGFDSSTPTFYILTHDLYEPPASLYEQGGRLLLVQHRREVPTAKTTNYLTMLKHRSAVQGSHALDLLYHDGRHVLEAASASVYFVKDGAILVPERDVLHGTIGTLVLGLARGHYPVMPGEIDLATAFSADEVYLTSTTRGVVPIVALDDRPVASGLVGPVVRDLMARYHEAVFGEHRM